MIILSGCKDLNLLGDCNETPQYQALSLSKQFIASQMIVSCGATTDFYTHITLEKNDFKNRNRDIIMEIKGHYNSENIAIKWENENNLRVDFHGDLKDIYNFKATSHTIGIHLYQNNKEVTDKDLENSRDARNKELNDWLLRHNSSQKLENPIK